MPIDTRLPASGFQRSNKKSSQSLKPARLVARINPVMRENDAGTWGMSDTLSAAVIGTIAGYLIARHSAEIDWILRIVIG